MPSDVQLRVAQVIECAETRVSRLIGNARDKVEQLANKQSGACDLLQKCFQDLHGSGETQRLAEISLDLKAKLEILFQAHDGSTDRVLRELYRQNLALERVLRQVTKINNTQGFHFHKGSDSNQLSPDPTLHNIRMARNRTCDMPAHQAREAGEQAGASQASDVMERINGPQSSVNRSLEEVRSLPQSAPSSQGDISVAGRELLSSFLVIWKGLKGAIRNLS